MEHKEGENPRTKRKLRSRRRIDPKGKFPRAREYRQLAGVPIVDDMKNRPKARYCENPNCGGMMRRIPPARPGGHPKYQCMHCNTNDARAARAENAIADRELRLWREGDQLMIQTNDKPGGVADWFPVQGFGWATYVAQALGLDTLELRIMLDAREQELRARRVD